MHFYANFLSHFELVLTIILQMTQNRMETLFSLIPDFLTLVTQYLFYSSQMVESSIFRSAFICMLYTH